MVKIFSKIKNLSVFKISAIIGIFAFIIYLALDNSNFYDGTDDPLVAILFGLFILGLVYPILWIHSVVERWIKNKELTIKLAYDQQKLDWERVNLLTYYNKAHNINQNDTIDELFEVAVRVVVSYVKASTSFIQRKLLIGYDRAVSILDQLCEAGVISEADGQNPRKVLIGDADEFIEKWKQK